jgi:hypothetical protein
MPEGIGRNAIAAQVGGAFCAGGGFVAAAAVIAVKPIAKPIPTGILVIIPASFRETTGL